MSGNTPNMLNDDKKTEMTTIQPKERESPQASTDLWSLYLGEANQRAKDKADVWNESLSAFLLFAGLFAGVVAAFLIDSRAGLHPSPSADSPSNTNSTGTKVPVSTLAVNFLWFISLTLTLISALGGVLGRTWIVKFSSVADTDLEGARLRWIHDDKAEHWHLHAVIAWITGLIQLALFLFLAGLAIQATTDHQSLGLTILPLVGATLILYIGITLLPIPSPATPYRTPFSDLFTHNEALKSESAKRAKTPRRGILELIAPLWRKLIIITEDPEVHVGIGWAILQQSFRDFVESAWTKLFKIPEDPEVHLGICWAVLQHSSQTATIHAAVRKLTGGEITPYQCQLLAKFGLPRKLSSRLVHLPLPTEAQADAVERLKNYLHVVMWMVGGCSPAVAEGFSILLRHDSLLHKLDALPTSCQGVAFAIQVHLLINIDTEEEIHNHGTDWTAMIDSLDNSFALDVFRAAIRGLEFPAGDVPLHKKRKFSHLRQDCARMLAAYNGSTCFSNTDLWNRFMLSFCNWRRPGRGQCAPEPFNCWRRSTLIDKSWAFKYYHPSQRTLTFGMQ
ncbi:hypothetical protein B0H16DRAFT_495198 [Mycena metata]|uniref:DUF6535 domain-containing protein n=1 Tax=Mycena metata TaxID=1033252 RepID=A0AAD7HAV5_9AGAR|nr:hypothetical protein B0H16DRAFT_495198 [Mycena metata]